LAVEDKIRWNKKHIDSKIVPEPLELITRYSGLSRGKQALDIACGLGRHSRYLAANGFEVDALDVSDVAIDSLQGIAHINAQEVDFDTYRLIKNRYDLILCTYFLDRDVFAQMYDALNSDGILIIETFIDHPNNKRNASNKSFLLKEGELQEIFSKQFEIIYIKEYWSEDYLGNKTMKVSFVAKKRNI